MQSYAVFDRQVGRVVALYGTRAQAQSNTDRLNREHLDAIKSAVLSGTDCTGARAIRYEARNLTIGRKH